MKSLLLAVFTFSLIMTISSSFIMEEVPNPEDYARKLIEVIRKNNEQEYLKAFEFTTKDYHWLHDRIQNDVHINEEHRNEWNRKFSDTTEVIADMNQMLTNGYEKISNWVKLENINVNELEYLRIYYDLQYDKRLSIHIIDEAMVIVKHKEKYYGISVRDAGYVNGRWVLGRVREVNELDQYFESLHGGYGNQYRSEMVDSTMVATDTTVAYAEEYATADSAYVVSEVDPELNKKQKKLKAKIAKKEVELLELYDQLYKEEPHK